jgi:hypothetical protein
VYIPRETNGFTDALSRIYANEMPGTVHVKTELIGGDSDEELDNPPRSDTVQPPARSQPVYAGVKGNSLNDHTVQPNSDQIYWLLDCTRVWY